MAEGPQQVNVDAPAVPRATPAPAQTGSAPWTRQTFWQFDDRANQVVPQIRSYDSGNSLQNVAVNSYFSVANVLNSVPNGANALANDTDSAARAATGQSTDVDAAKTLLLAPETIVGATPELLDAAAAAINRALSVPDTPLNHRA